MYDANRRLIPAPSHAASRARFRGSCTFLHVICDEANLSQQAGYLSTPTNCDIESPACELSAAAYA
jgi:hypothetical protein